MLCGTLCHVHMLGLSSYYLVVVCSLLRINQNQIKSINQLKSINQSIKYEVRIVSGVLNFTSAYHRTLRTSKNAAELAEVSQLAVDESSEFDNFSYEKRKNEQSV